MLAGDSFIAKDPAEFVNPVDPADKQALEIQLQCDPQCHVTVKRIVMGAERPRGGATVLGLQYWRLDLDEPPFVEEPPDFANNCRPLVQDIARVEV